MVTNVPAGPESGLTLVTTGVVSFFHWNSHEESESSVNVAEQFDGTLFINTWTWEHQSGFAFTILWERHTLEVR